MQKPDNTEFCADFVVALNALIVFPIADEYVKPMAS